MSLRALLCAYVWSLHASMFSSLHVNLPWPTLLNCSRLHNPPQLCFAVLRSCPLRITIAIAIFSIFFTAIAQLDSWTFFRFICRRTPFNGSYVNFSQLPSSTQCTALTYTYKSSFLYTSTTASTWSSTWTATNFFSVTTAATKNKKDTDTNKSVTRSMSYSQNSQWSFLKILFKSVHNAKHRTRTEHSKFSISV